MAESLTERDEQVLAVVDQEIERARETTDDADGEIEQLRALCRDLAERVDAVEQEQRAAREKRRDLFREIESLKQAINADGQAVTGTTELEQYATAPQGVRSDLSANKRRAVRLYEHWTEIAWRPDANEKNRHKWRVDTATRKNAKNNPSRLKHELERLEDRSLNWNDIYRTIQQMAKMSGGEEHTDEFGRTHIVGGGFEYHEKPTSDNRKMKRVLKEATE